MPLVLLSISWHPGETEAHVLHVRCTWCLCLSSLVQVWDFCSVLRGSSSKRRSWLRGKLLPLLRCKQILFIYFSSLWVGGTGRLDSILFIRVLYSVQHFFPASLQWTSLLLFLLFSHSVMSDSLQPHGLQHSRPACPLPTPGACSDSCPLSQWCIPTISSSVSLFLLPSVFASSRVFFQWGSSSRQVAKSRGCLLCFLP